MQAEEKAHRDAHAAPAAQPKERLEDEKVHLLRFDVPVEGPRMARAAPRSKGTSA